MSSWKFHELRKLCEPTGANANILIRLVVGGVFLNEGILKFLYPATEAAGRFAKIGLPHAEILGPLVAMLETVCGAMIILGFLLRPAAIALFIDITVAIITTKVPVLMGHGYLGFTVMQVPHYGFLSMVHEARTDFSMWFGLVFLLSTGPGRWSVDSWLAEL